MKKLLLLLCSAALALGLIACGGDGDKSSSSSSAKTYTITLLTEGGTGVSPTQDVVYGEEYTLSSPTRTGYTFDGWKDSSGNEYALSGTWQTQSDLTLKATWKANEYQLILPAGENAKFSDESTTKTLTVVYDGAIPTLPTPTKEGYTFTSWTYDSKALPNIWNFTTNITANANWVEVMAEKCTITFVQAGEVMTTRTVDKGATLTDVPNPAQKTGYDCVWDRTDFTNITQNITVTAVETAKTYTITFDAKGGSVSSATQTVTYNGAYTLPEPTKEDSHFLGWYDENDVKYTGGVWTTADDVKLTAKWQEKEAWTGFY